MIIFHWATPKGLDTPHGKKKLLSRWNLTCKAFGEKELVCVSDENIVMTDSEVSFKCVASLGEALKLSKGKVVFVEQGGSSISNFNHPKEATYVFGSDYGELPYSDIEIDSVLPLHSDIAAGIVLYHRYQQWH